MKTLIDFDNHQHQTFFTDFCKRKFQNNKASLPRQPKKKISKSKQSEPSSTEVKTSTLDVETEVTNKKKTKYVNLYSQEGKNAQVVLLKGRHHCDCQAAKHELVNNCLYCGRIVCKQEGSGPCLFCGHLVCTPQEQKEINSKTKSSTKLKETLLEKSRPKGWEAAVSHRNRLLEYDRTSERRTRVTDDDSDYFSAGSVWLSAEERQKLDKYQQSLHDKKHASRLYKKMTFDFAGRQVIEDNSTEHDVDEAKIREITRGEQPQSTMLSPDLLSDMSSDRDVAPGVNAPLLQYIEGIGSSLSRLRSDWSRESRVQDPEIQEMSDTGRCLSMHQPWASLLVEGIKLHEGRTWYSGHRGRLWIASTAKPPEPTLVRELENRYRVLNPDKNLKFPTFYPTGCLLGCVHVDDCLPEEEYQKIYPEGEGGSPYMFICSNPISLRLRFPIKGQHKIYQLDKSIHQAAIKCIQKMSKIEADQANAG
ncbi:activating signal cointegrator 1 isoform X2 [Leptidea sinapis]|nr:activating signal cointegrator 1 isoform X2 [Leptidea sinapis]